MDERSVTVRPTLKCFAFHLPSILPYNALRSSPSQALSHVVHFWTEHRHILYSTGLFFLFFIYFCLLYCSNRSTMSSKQSGSEKGEPACKRQHSRVTLDVKLDIVKRNKNGERPADIARYLSLLPPPTVQALLKNTDEGCHAVPFG